MDYTDVFTSEDDTFMKMRLYGSTIDNGCPTTPSRKVSTPKPILRSSTPLSSHRRIYESRYMNNQPNSHDDFVAVAINAVKSNDLDKVKQICSSISTNPAFLPNSKWPIFTDGDGRTALHLSSEHGLVEMSRLLLHSFPAHNVNFTDQTGSTALHRAAGVGNVEIIQMLLERGAQINIQENLHGNTALHESAWKGYSHAVNLLCVVGRLPNLVNYTLFTPLHLAVQGGHNQTTRNIIKSGGDISAQNRFGDSPLHTAVRYGHAGVSRILVVCITTTAPHLLSSTNENGDTALHIAAALKRRKVTRILRDAGADAYAIRNKQGDTPMDVAIKKQHSEIVAILQAKDIRATPPHPSPTPFVVQFTGTSRARSQSPPSSKKTNFMKHLFSRKKNKKSSNNCPSNRKIAEPEFNTKPNTSNQPIHSINDDVNKTCTTTHQMNCNCSQSQLTALNQRHEYQANIYSNNNKYPHDNKRLLTRKHNNDNVGRNMAVMERPYKYQESVQTFSTNLNISPGPLLRSRSDESLNQSEHKTRMQQERMIKNNVKTSPVKGRRVVLVSSPQQKQQNLGVQQIHKMSVLGQLRPSPDGQTTDSLTSPPMYSTNEKQNQNRFIRPSTVMEWKKMNPNLNCGPHKYTLPSSKV